MAQNQSVNALDSYPWTDGQSTQAHQYLLPAVADILEATLASRDDVRILDLGCGNGFVTGWLNERGYEVTGVDPSTQGIEQARAQHPEIDFHQGSIYDPLQEQLDPFDVVLSLEVVEHVYDPHRYAEVINRLLKNRGLFIVSTPFHGYWKNLAVALLGRFDRHVDPLRTHGHIKFWTPDTLGRLLTQHDLEVDSVRRVGRVPPLAKSMVVSGHRLPSEGTVGPTSPRSEPKPRSVT